MNHYLYYEHSIEDYVDSVKSFDIHSEWWLDKIRPLFQLNIEQDSCHLFFYGPPATGKYSHALYLIELLWKEKLTTRSLFEIAIPIQHSLRIKNIPEDNYLFRTSQLHIEIDVSQLGDNYMDVWNEFCLEVIGKFSIVICLNTHNAPIEWLQMVYTYLLPSPPFQTNNYKNFCNHKNRLTHFWFISESTHIPHHLYLQLHAILFFPKPEHETYKELCKWKIENRMNNVPYVYYSHVNVNCLKPFIEQISVDGILSIKEIYNQLFEMANKHNSLQSIHKKKKFQTITDNFTTLSEKLANLILSICSIENMNQFSIVEIRTILNEIECRSISLEDVIWYLIGYFINGHSISYNRMNNVIYDGTVLLNKIGRNNLFKFNKIIWAEYVCIRFIEEIIMTCMEKMSPQMVENHEHETTNIKKALPLSKVASSDIRDFFLMFKK